MKTKIIKGMIMSILFSRISEYSCWLYLRLETNKGKILDLKATGRNAVKIYRGYKCDQKIKLKVEDDFIMSIVKRKK